MFYSIRKITRLYLSSLIQPIQIILSDPKDHKARVLYGKEDNLFLTKK
nr:MAG TPA: hypothetical protein [Bacteriophage sp.]